SILSESLNGSAPDKGLCSLARIPASFLLGWGAKLGGYSEESDVSVVISDSSTSALGGIVIGEGKAYWYRSDLATPQASRISKLVEPINWDRWESGDICSLELSAALCGCAIVPADRPVIILCDNAAAIAAISKLSAKSARMNDLLKSLASAWGYSKGVRAYHLSTDENWLADALSRQSLDEVRKYMVGASMSEVDLGLILDKLEESVTQVSP
ncbi:hypothetical protein Pmar_PMAR022804, partial [Perkinsus marinus ATCC 50983]